MVKSMIMTSADGVLHAYGEMCGCAVNALALDGSERWHNCSAWCSACPYLSVHSMNRNQSINASRQETCRFL